MWINEALAKNGGVEGAHVGVVQEVKDGKVTVHSHTQLAQVELLNSFGIFALPAVGDEVLVLPMLGGEYFCIGNAQNKAALLEGETVITSSGGGRITLKADGSVDINGLIISADGKLLK